MKYDLKKERNKRDIITEYIRNNVPNLSKDYYLKYEKKGEISSTNLYTLYEYCGFTLPEDFHKYSVSSIKMNCILKDIKMADFFNIFAEKTDTSFYWIKRQWTKDKYISLYEYKDVLDEILGEIYTPCHISNDAIKFFGETDVVFPVVNTSFYCWRLYENDSVKKEGIIAAKSKESAMKKLETWHLCTVDEFFHIYSTTNEIESDIGVLNNGSIDLQNSYIYNSQIPFNNEVYAYDTLLVKINCCLKNMKAGDFFKSFVEKTKIPLCWIKKKYWLEEDTSLENYKDVIDEILEEIYIPCVYKDNGVKPINKDVVVPVLKNRFYGWKLLDNQNNTVLKKGIIVAKSEKTALNKLNKWYLCKEEESFVVDCTTKELDADVGVF